MHLRSHAGTILAALVFVASLAWLSHGVHVGSGGEDTPPFHIDEAHKLGEAFYYHLLFQRRDPGHPAWTEDFYARTNPPVGKYIFGAVLAMAGHPVRDQQQQKDFEANWQSPERLRRLVPDDMLRVTRGTSVVFGAAVCLLLFIVARRAAGTAAGLIAALLLLGNPSFTQTARRGLTDTILLFHLTLIVPVALMAVGVLRRHWQGQLTGGVVRRWCILLAWTVVAPGLAIALATGSKLNGWLTGPSYAAGLILAALLCTSLCPVWRRLALASITTFLAAVTAIAVFVGINPYFYHEPIRRMVRMLDIWGDWLLTQQVFPGPGLFTLHQRTTAVGHHSLCDVSLPLSWLTDTLHAGSLGGWLAALGFAVGLVYLIGQCLPHSHGLRFDLVRLVPLAACLPVSALADEPPVARRPAADQHRLDAAVILCWVLVCTVGITLWLPLLWDRHLLPPYLTICLTTAIGLAVLPRGVRSIATLLVGRPSQPGRWRVVAGALSAAALWIVMAFTPWVISPMLLPDPTAWSNPDAIATQANSYLLHGNVGFMFLCMGMNKQAAEQLGTALMLLDQSAEAGPSMLAQRCCILRLIAQAHAATGNRLGRSDALKQYIPTLEKLRDTMKSADPYVRGAYDLNIAEGRADLARLARTQPGK